MMWYWPGMGWWMLFGGIWMLLFWGGIIALAVWGNQKANQAGELRLLCDSKA